MKKKKRTLKNYYSLRELLDNIKLTNICIIEVPEGEDRGAVNLFEEKVAENFPKNWERRQTSKSRKHREFQTS